MKNKIKTFGLLLLLNVIALGQVMAQKSNQWMLDKDHTSVTFDVKHFFSTVNGNFTEYDGSFIFNPNDLKNSKFSFTIPVSSINTNNGKRDTHLKSEDFFNAAKYPAIKFESTRIEKKADNNYVAYGDITIKDVTKKIAVPFSVTGQMEHPMMKGTKIMGMSFNTELDRTDFNVGVGDWASDMVVGDTVVVTVNLELNQKG